MNRLLEAGLVAWCVAGSLGCGGQAGSAEAGEALASSAAVSSFSGQADSAADAPRLQEAREVPLFGAGEDGTLVTALGAAPVDGNTDGGVGCIDGGTACTNCLDDDGDGLMDAFDPECTGPLDNDEATFATGIPGDNVDQCQDCFFDGNSGHGDDGCQYATACLYGESPPGGRGSSCFDCEVSERCQNTCLDKTPNGCDCFGCCDVQDSGGEVHTVRLSETCSVDTVGDPAACEACVPSPDCFNDCGPCEICLGKTQVDRGCDDGPVLQCFPGETPCDEANPCSAGDFCLTGCCIAGPR